MKLGIIVVYLVEPENERLLEVHFAQIERCTDVPYTIYGTVNRLRPQFLPRVQNHPRLKIVVCPTIEERISAEHGYYLDQLARAAIDDDCTHVVAMHVNSFPVRTGWVQQMAEAITEQKPVCAILRTENGDTMLPFPAGLMFSRSFYLAQGPHFQVPTETAESARFRRFMEEFQQPVNSGVGYGYALWNANLDWTPMLRSNAIDEHYLIGGIYGDAIFHLGFAAREYKSDRGDKLKATGWKGVCRRLVQRMPWGVRIALRKIVPPTWIEQKSQIAWNRHAYEVVREQLLDSPDSYLRHLRTGIRQPQADAGHASFQNRPNSVGPTNR